MERILNYNRAIRKGQIEMLHNINCYIMGDSEITLEFIKNKLKPFIDFERETGDLSFRIMGAVFHNIEITSPDIFNFNKVIVNIQSLDESYAKYPPIIIKYDY